MVIDTLALLWYYIIVAVMSSGQCDHKELERTKSCRIERGSVHLVAYTLKSNAERLELAHERLEPVKKRLKVAMKRLNRHKRL